MSNIRIPMAVCAAVAEILVGTGSHATLDAIFEAAGAIGSPPGLPHHSKWKTWLFTAGKNPECDSLALIGNLIEEFMDLPPESPSETVNFYGNNYDPLAEYNRKRERLSNILEEHGFRYYQGGRVLPNDNMPVTPNVKMSEKQQDTEPKRPSSVEELLQIIIKGLPR
ncbi:hypothetical protein, partial [Desulfobacula phenolica]